MPAKARLAGDPWRLAECYKMSDEVHLYTRVPANGMQIGFDPFATAGVHNNIASPEARVSALRLRLVEKLETIIRETFLPEPCVPVVDG